MTIDEVLQCDLKDSIYSAYEQIHGNDFVINNKAFKLPQTIGEISFKLDSIYMPIVKNSVDGKTTYDFNIYYY